MENPDHQSGEVAALKTRLADLEATLDAIRTGAVDALVVSGPDGEQIFTLKGADQAYRVLVETMNEGAVTVSNDGAVLYANSRFAAMVKTPLEKVLGVPLLNFIVPRERSRLRAFLKGGLKQNSTIEATLRVKNRSKLAVHLSGNPLPNAEVAGTCFVVTDISQRKQIEEERRRISRNIMEAQESERQRVARDLHDGVNQLLSSTKHRLHDIEARLREKNRANIGSDVMQVRKLVDRTIGEIRAISRNLRPSELDDLGLVAAIRSLGAEFQNRTDIRVEFALAESKQSLSGHAELIIYRITQEALANVEKHARAKVVTIELSSSSRGVLLRVSDNGRGIAERANSRGHWGLINMRERASHVNGRLDIKSERGKGTRVELEVPT
jgi:two-component system, NarL family, sensor kinase